MTKPREGVAGATIFTKLDIKDGYNLIWINGREEWKTAFAPTIDIMNTK